MKRFIKTLALSVVAIAFVSANAMAYQITQDIAGERTQSRNATDGQISAAYYNPAGLTGLDEGIYIDIGNRMLYLSKETELAATTGTCESTTFTALLPNVALAWRTGNGAIYFTTSIVGGGAGGDWDQESLNAVGLGAAYSAIEGTEYTIGYTLGASGRINDMIAITGGVRLLHKFVDAEYEGPTVTAGLSAETEETRGYGWQGTFGIMLTPMEGLNIAFNYYTEAVIKSEKTSINNAGVELSETNASEMSPAMLAIGLGYTVTDQLAIQLSYNITFESDEAYGQDYTGLPGYANNQNDGHKIGFGAEFQVMDMLLVSLGIAYEISADSAANIGGTTEFQNPGLNKMVYGIGAVITPIEMVSIDVGFAYHQYLTREDSAKTQEHSQTAIVFGIGVSAHF